MGNCDSSVNVPHEEVDVSRLNYQEEMRHFYIICVVLNPARSQTRMKQYLKFKQRIESYGVKLITVECAYENSPFVVTKQNYEPNHIQLRTSNAFFQKENFINIAISKLPRDAKYVIWCDYDVEFLNPDWVKETIRMLNMHRAVQLCEEIAYTDENGDIIRKEESFAAQLFRRKILDNKTLDESIESAKYAWGFRYETLRELGGIIDFSPIGNNDKIMAYCLAQRIDQYVPLEMSGTFIESIKTWEMKAHILLNTGVGFVIGSIKVLWSKEREESKGHEYWNILITHKFDHKDDMYMDKQGIYCIEKSKGKLERDLKDVFVSMAKVLE